MINKKHILDTRYPYIKLPKYFEIESEIDEAMHHDDEPIYRKYYNTCIIDGYEFPVYKTEFDSFNSLEVTAGTTGYKGGDSGHGCRTFIRIKDTSCTDIQINKLTDGDRDEGVEIILGGDSELGTMIQGLEFILRVLKSQQ